MPSTKELSSTKHATVLPTNYCQTESILILVNILILDIVAVRAGMRINKVNSVKRDAFPQHNISNAEYKEILIIIYKYKYTVGLAVVGG